MEDLEVPIEQAQETIQHHATHERDRRSMTTALTSALLAALAAIASMMAGHHANEAMLHQIEASNQWNYYQAKGIKSAVLSSKLELLSSLEKSREDNSGAKKLEAYKVEQEEIRKKAESLEQIASHQLELHEILARSVTFFQVAIAVAAISLLTRKRHFFFMSLGFGLFGAVFLVQALLNN